MREAHPGWGPLTLLVELKKDARFVRKTLPSRSRIAAYLKQKDRVRKYERHRKLPEPKPQVIERPHQEWEVDAQGKITIDGVGSASIINIGDVFSHLKIDSLPCLRTSHASTSDYQLVLRRAFVQYGLPDQISLDHDSVFYDNQTCSPFPTVLHLWLISLGIGVRFIHKTPPAEHAQIERTHQTITNQAILGQTFTSAARTGARPVSTGQPRVPPGYCGGVALCRLLHCRARSCRPTSTRSVFDKSPMILLSGGGSFRTSVGIATI